MSITTRRQGLVAVLAVLAACAVSVIAAPVASATARLGINVNRVFNGIGYNQSFVDMQLSAASREGVTLVREDALWAVAEPNAPVNGVHSYNWAPLDFIEKNLAKYHMQWQPIIDYSAPWDQTVQNGPPTSNADYAAYAQAFAQRYGPGGDFWRANPSLPYLPVSTFEIWNEEDGNYFWGGASDPVAYANLYAAAYKALKQVNPAATVVIGGLTGNWRYIQNMYWQFAQLGVHPDAIALHPYGNTPSDSYNMVKLLKQDLDWIGQMLNWPDPHNTPIYLTEFGWPTAGYYSSVVSDATRASYLPSTADTLARSDCGVAAVFPYAWTTPMQNTQISEDWYGIYKWTGGDTQTSIAYSKLLQQYNAGRQSKTTTKVCY